MTNFSKGLNKAGICVVLREDILRDQSSYIEKRLQALSQGAITFSSSQRDLADHNEIEILIGTCQPIIDNIIQELPNLRWVHFLSSGIDPIWSMSFKKENYLLSRSTGTHAATIAEYIIGAILGLLKEFKKFSELQKHNEWNRHYVQECSGKTLGIIGLGAIGQHLAKIAHTLGMRVIGTVSEPRQIDYVDTVYAPHDLPKLLTESDFVTLLAPLTPETHHLINKSTLNNMKKTAWLINVSRGGLINETDLVNALERNLIAGAVLDVFETEPLPPTSPLWGLQNVFITPHIAGTTQHYMSKALDIFEINYTNLLNGKKLHTPIDLNKQY